MSAAEIVRLFRWQLLGFIRAVLDDFRGHTGEEASLELPVTPGHVRHIRVQGLAADDVPGLTVQVHAEGEDAVLVDWPFAKAPRDGEPDAQGAFAPGRYVAEAETADGRRASVSFEVRGDGEPPVMVAGFK